MRDLADDVRRLLKREPVDAARGRRLYAIRKTTYRNRWWLLPLVIVALAVAAVGSVNPKWLVVAAVPVEKAASWVVENRNVLKYAQKYKKRVGWAIAGVGAAVAGATAWRRKDRSSPEAR